MTKRLRWLGLLLLAVVCSVDTVHARVAMSIVGQCGTTVCAGSPIVCTARLTNRSTPPDEMRWAAIAMGTVVHHADGTTSDSGNILPAPVALPTLNSAHVAPIVNSTFASDAGAVLRVDVTGRGEGMDVVGATWTGKATVLVAVESCEP